MYVYIVGAKWNEHPPPNNLVECITIQAMYIKSRKLRLVCYTRGGYAPPIGSR
jgi:hypothetical protein